MNDVIQEYQARIEKVLDTCVAGNTLRDCDATPTENSVPERLSEAMRYSTLAGGKRFRALLVYAAGLAVDAPLARLDSVASAFECMHAYSLIHDDLPAMDNDNLRRGKATNHIQFDEATAILAGDALQTLAFQLISDKGSGLSDAQCRAISHELAISSGSMGMVGGQMLDILATNNLETNNELSISQLEDVHRRKTGALIRAAVVCGGLCSDYTNEPKQNSLEQYANNVGLAFQVIDDILDIESSTEQLGKTSGSDQALGKATYPALLGIAKSKKLVEDLYQQAIVSLASISDNTSLLADLATLVVKRKN